MFKRTSASGRLIALVALMIGAGAVPLGAAPTEAQQQAIRSSCQSDYRTYCSSVPTGGSAALQCLEKNIANLSQSCQQAVRAVSGGAQSAPGSGSGTATTTPPAGGTTAGSAPAASAPTAKAPTIIVIQPGQEIALMREACGGDYRAHCAGVRIIGGGALGCLVSHAASLSAGCKAELSRLGQRF